MASEEEYTVLIVERDELKAALRELAEAADNYDTAYYNYHINKSITEHTYVTALTRYKRAIVEAERLLNPKEAPNGTK